MPIKSLTVKHTVTFDSCPLVCFTNFPGPGAELRPEDIRQLAAALNKIAQDSEALRFATSHGPITCEYPLLVSAAPQPARIRRPVFGPLAGLHDPIQVLPPVAQGGDAQSERTPAGHPCQAASESVQQDDLQP